MFAVSRVALSRILTLILLGTLASCSNFTSASPGQHLWTTRANWDGNGAPTLYDRYTGLIITLTSSDPSRATAPVTVNALDPGTGHQDWSFVTDQTPQLAMVVKGLVLVATSGPAPSPISTAGGPPSLLVLNDRSGSEVRDINMASGATALGLTHGTVVATDGTGLYGYSPSTGDNTWEWRPSVGCSMSQAVASLFIASVLTHCANGDVNLTSVNPATGVTLWSRIVGYYDSSILLNQVGGEVNPYGMSAQGRFVVITSIGSASIFTLAGMPLDNEQVAGYGQPFVASQGDHLFIVYDNTDGDLTVKDLDTRTRASHILISRSFTPTSVTLAGGTLYILATPSWPLLPVFVVAVDTGSESYTVSALPYPNDGLTYTYGNGSVLAVGQELLVAAEGPALTAYSTPLSASTAPGIQAARPGAWPKACSALSASTLSQIVGDAYVSTPQDVPPSLGPLSTSACEYAPLDRRFPAITLGVGWSAKTITGARELMVNSARWFGMIHAWKPGDQTYSCQVQCSALVRVGPTIYDVKFAISWRSWRSVIDQIGRALRRERPANG